MPGIPITEEQCWHSTLQTGLIKHKNKINGDNIQCEQCAFCTIKAPQSKWSFFTSKLTVYGRLFERSSNRTIQINRDSPSIWICVHSDIPEQSIWTASHSALELQSLSASSEEPMLSYLIQLIL